MSSQLTSIGYDFEPSKFSPALGFSGFKVIISGQPTQRYFDIKSLHIPTFDGRFYHLTNISRHELAPSEEFTVCLGEASLESFKGESLKVFTFGGSLKAVIEKGDLFCDFSSKAPIFKIKDDPEAPGVVMVDELMDFLAEYETRLTGHMDELYSRLANFDPYQIFLASLISLQKRADSIPLNLRRERFHQITSSLKKIIQIVQTSYGWDGTSPDLEELLSKGGV